MTKDEQIAALKKGLYDNQRKVDDIYKIVKGIGSVIRVTSSNTTHKRLAEIMINDVSYLVAETEETYDKLYLGGDDNEE